ncbi:alpha-protein kinase 3 isoform X2 [Electrophorus electricus]|uniref:alpha-protein kinase 3 isoform X2 n=1 Tax=Electrophorus electricus TaxID=8005 RepID=UPI0015D01345|nr:alpha-protein kinase 3 isoform X2 [Electrophorus electricus]
MTSRRPMTRSYSGNGRCSSQNGEDVPSPRMDSRNYLSNVRPENRSTFCTVMAQLTEETQPCFETTIKSKAVSEACNVKFSCVVTGHPVPELTWYKDDMELDRYCGLPKYEIFRNGKTHTLHIYNCTVDDAAIYQASARNGKGIVSCSGVLEVGTMNEYKIHQRFFAKLKQKAELKRREQEEIRRQEEEKLQEESLSFNQDHSLRKRRFSEGLELNSLSALYGGESEDTQEAIAEEQTALFDEEYNGLSVETHRLSSDLSENKDRLQLNYVHEKAETGGTAQVTNEEVSRKKNRISNGFEDAVTNQPSQVTAEEEDSHKGISLTEYLSKSFQSQTSEEQQKGLAPLQEIKCSDTSTIQEKERDRGKEIEKEWMKTVERKKEQERCQEREQEKVAQLEPEHSVAAVSEAKAPAPREADQADHLQKSAFSSVFHSLKGMLFGKSKKSPETTKKVSDVNGEKEIPLHVPEARPRLPQTQPQEPGVCVVGSQQLVPMEVDELNQRSELSVNGESPQKTPASSHLKTEIVGLNLKNDSNGFTTENISITSGRHPESSRATQLSSREHGEQQSVSEEGDLEALPEIPSSQLFKAAGDHTEAGRGEDAVGLPRESADQECTATAYQMAQAREETHATEERDDTADVTHSLEASQTGPNRTDLERDMRFSEAWPSQTVDRAPLLVSSDSENVEEMRVDEASSEHDSYTDEIGAPTAEVAAEENLPKVQEGYSFTKGSDVMMKVAEASVANEKTDTVEVASKSDLSLNDRDQEGDIDFQGVSMLALGVSQQVFPLQDSVVENDLRQNKNSIPALVVGPGESEKEAGTDRDDKEENVSGAENKDHITSTKDMNSIEEKKKNIVEQDEGTEEKKADRTKKKGDNSLGENKNEPATLNMAIEAEMPKYTRNSEIEEKQTHLNSNVVDKPKIFTKAQPERFMVESWEQSVVPPIIILPDTRETVIKNVAKMRATPLATENKLTMPEKVKREEPVSIPRIDALVTEPERVLQPLAQEVACIFRDSELKSEEPVSDADNAPNEVIKDHRVVTVVEHVDATPAQQARNFDWVLTVQNKQDSKHLILEPSVGDREEPAKISSGKCRGNDNSSIPIISIACADDVASSQGQEQVCGKPILLDAGFVLDNADLKKQAYTIASVSTTHMEDTAKNSANKDRATEILTTMLRKVEVELAHVTSSSSGPGEEKSTLIKEQNMSDKRYYGEIHLNSDDVSSQSSAKPSQNSTGPDVDKVSLHKAEPDADRLQRDKPAMEKLGLTTPVGPTLPPLSPASLRRLMAKNNPNLEGQGSAPAISSDGSEKKGDESGGSTPTSALSCESSPKMKRRDSLTLIPSATPEELASGARRKIYLAKTKSEDEGSDTQSRRDSPYMSPSQARRAAFLQLQSGQQTPPMERRSPLLGRRKATLEVPKSKEEMSEEPNSTTPESKPAEKEKLDPFKAPQVIRKIRGEAFSDASGHLKLWCQFFNVLSDSTIKWFRDETEIVEIKRNAGDESQVALAIVQASNRDCGVYGCTIKNEYGSDTTDYLLSTDILAEFFLRDDLEVGEEIEMMPLLFTKGLADSSYWGEKFFGRIMTEEVQLGQGCMHKTSRAKVIYGLDPIFESGSTCIAKVRNPIAYGTKEENNLAEKNLEATKQECKIQNMIREYCKIFAAEARVIENFGFSLEVIPLYLMSRPANTIPYATVEADLKGTYLTYCLMDNTGSLVTQSTSELEQKCCTFQHWIHQWTNGNLLVTRLEGVDTKITNIRIATKSKGYQGLTDEGSLKILEQFATQHQCNYYCGLLGLRPLKPMDPQQQPKVKTSRSPLLARRPGPGSASPQLQKKGSGSPQLQKKGSGSPQVARKGSSSPKVVKKTGEDEENKATTKHKTVEVPKGVRMR